MLMGSLFGGGVEVHVDVGHRRGVLGQVHVGADDTAGGGGWGIGQWSTGWVHHNLLRGPHDVRPPAVLHP